MKIRLGLLMAVLAPGLGWAAPAPSGGCVAGLSGNARMIYDATLPTLTPGMKIRDAVTTKTKELVMAGQIDRSSARPAAQAAAQCLNRR